MSSNKYKNGNAIPIVYNLCSFNNLLQEATPGVVLLKKLILVLFCSHFNILVTANISNVLLFSLIGIRFLLNSPYFVSRTQRTG